MLLLLSFLVTYLLTSCIITEVMQPVMEDDSRLKMDEVNQAWQCQQHTGSKAWAISGPIVLK